MKSIIIILLCLFFLTGCSNNTNNNSSYSAERMANSASTTSSQEDAPISVIISQSSQNIIQETEISSFTTEILTDDDNRNHNISITCEKINGYTVKSGETFSFTDTIGKATEEKGYEKANVFDENGNTIKGLGGGNCQVSSTLYNAVLEADGFEIVERHPHNQEVYYVPEGKDAAVSYGSVDFKFKNNNDYDIKIYAKSDSEEITITLKKLS